MMASTTGYPYRRSCSAGAFREGLSNSPSFSNLLSSSARIRGSSISNSGCWDASAANFYRTRREEDPLLFSMTRCTTPGSRTWSPDSSRSSSRSNSPIPSYTDALCKVSRRLRERSIPPPPPPPAMIKPYPVPPVTRSSVRASGKPPPVPRVVASDFYRGRIRSIYEREPLFRDFARNLRLDDGKTNIYNASTLNQIKKDFYSMVEEKWRRKNFSDPSVEHDLGTKLYPWQNVVGKSQEPASIKIARIQESRPRLATPPPLPRLTVYHRSTFS